MLQAPPHHFRAGAVASAAPHHPAELGDPGDRLAERRRRDRRGGPDGWPKTALAMRQAPTARSRGQQGRRASMVASSQTPARPGRSKAPRHGVSVPPPAIAVLSRCPPLCTLRCQTAMPQRHEDHGTRSIASSAVSTATVVNHTHAMGSTAAGGSTAPTWAVPSTTAGKPSAVRGCGGHTVKGP